MTSPQTEDYDLPMWKIVVRHLISPRTWIYPIIILIIAFFVLPRLSKQTAPHPGGNNETILFGGSDNPGPAESTDADGNIHRFAVPQGDK